MFDQEKQLIEAQVRAFCEAQGLPAPAELNWSQIPFAGEWGISTSLFQLAADEARQKAKLRDEPAPSQALAKQGDGVGVPQRAAQLAADLARSLGTPPGFSRVEAVKGYLNLYFSAPGYAARVLEAIAAAGDKYGWGPSKARRLMVEFSQPNTHKAFHVGHLRNMILGAALANILEAAGYE
ncbi:MAG TPA: arginine--tRNA ligase, partial [Anaerolineales bacterium]